MSINGLTYPILERTYCLTQLETSYSLNFEVVWLTNPCSKMFSLSKALSDEVFLMMSNHTCTLQKKVTKTEISNHISKPCPGLLANKFETAVRALGEHICKTRAGLLATKFITMYLVTKFETCWATKFENVLAFWRPYSKIYAVFLDDQNRKSVLGFWRPNSKPCADLQPTRFETFGCDSGDQSWKHVNKYRTMCLQCRHLIPALNAWVARA